MGGRRKPDRNEVDTTGERIEPTDLLPQPESGIVVGDRYCQSGNERDSGEGKLDSMDLPARPGCPETTVEDEPEPELGQSRMDVDGEAGSVDLLPQSAVSENRRGRERGGVVVEREVFPVDPPRQSDIGTSGGT